MRLRREETQFVPMVMSPELTARDKLSKLAQTSREKLRAFAEAPAPPDTWFNVWCFGLLFWMCRIPYGSQWVKSLMEIGGVESARLMMTVAGFDRNAAGIIEDDEWEIYQKNGEKLITDAVSSLANFAIVTALLVVLTHQNSIGRPAPWKASVDSIEYFSAETAERLTWTCFTCNIIAEGLALCVLCLSVTFRHLLTNVVPTLEGKLAMLEWTNILATLYWLAAWDCCLIIVVVFLGALLASAPMGLMAVTFLFATLIALLFVMFPMVYQAALLLHAEVIHVVLMTADSRKLVRQSTRTGHAAGDEDKIQQQRLGSSLYEV